MKTVGFYSDHKTKSFCLEECYQEAEVLLEMIEINNDFAEIAKEQAFEVLGERDVKDVDFVALHFSLNSNGVLTRDKDITDQEDVETWQLKDVGELIAKVHKGAMTFMMLDYSANAVWKILVYVFTNVWQGIIKGLLLLCNLFNIIATKSVEAIAGLPKELLLILGGAVFFALLFNRSREAIGDFFIMIWEEVKGLIKKLKVFKDELIELFKEFFDFISPLFVATSEIGILLLKHSHDAYLELERLETSTI